MSEAVVRRLDSRKLPRISIVIPNFNGSEFLGAAIQSVLEQNYPDLQLIVIDGGSTDGSVEIIKRYADDIDYWCSEPDGGQYDAINKGFTHASGEIYGWLNSDDIYLPWSLHTVGAVFSQLPFVHWLSTRYPVTLDALGNISGTYVLNGFSKEAFLDGGYLPKKPGAVGWIQQESTFWRADLWKQSGGLDIEYSLAADFGLWAAFYRHADLYGINVPLAGFRMHDAQRSLDIDRYFEQADRVLEQLRVEEASRAPAVRTLPRIKAFIGQFFKNAWRAESGKLYLGQFIESAGRDHPGQWKAVSRHFSP